MRVLLQRVSRGSVSVEGRVIGQISQGVVLLVGMSAADKLQDVAKLAKKIVNLRIFSDEHGRFAHSLLDTSGEALVVSQFTLYADVRKGRRPSFIDAAAPEYAEPLIEHFVERLRAEGVSRVETGVFGASMDVILCNRGPVTIWLDSETMTRA